MKLRTAALAGASLLFFATPALARGDGWYLGLGAGWSQLSDANYHDPLEIDKGGSTAFAWQLIAGVIWSLSPQLDLQLDYRYIQVGKTSHFYSSTLGVPSGTKSFGELNSNNVMLNIRWFFQPP